MVVHIEVTNAMLINSLKVMRMSTIMQSKHFVGNLLKWQLDFIVIVYCLCWLVANGYLEHMELCTDRRLKYTKVQPHRSKPPSEQQPEDSYLLFDFAALAWTD